MPNQQGVAEGIFDKFKKKPEEPKDPNFKAGWELCNKDPAADVGFYLKKHGAGLDRSKFIQGFNANAKSRGMRQYGDWGGSAVNHDLMRYKEIMRDKGVAEGVEELDESDLILNPASISKAVRGLVPHDSDRTDHEIEMAKSDLYQAGKNSVRVYELIKDISEEEGLEGWVQEKIIKAADYLNTIAEYLEGKKLPETKIFWDADKPAEPWHTIDAIAGRNRNESIDGVGPSTKMFTSEGEVEEGKTGPGLWANIHAKRERIKKGSGERMRKPGSEGAPTAANLKSAQAGTKK
jgi:hypothetical protein